MIFDSVANSIKLLILFLRFFITFFYILVIFNILLVFLAEGPHLLPYRTQK